MSNLDNGVLDTYFGKLVSGCVVAMVSASIGRTACTERDIVAAAMELAGETVRRLEDREKLLAAQAKEAWENRPKEPILWAPPEGAADRRGCTWTDEENAALIAAFNNGERAATIAARHLRTATSICARLASHACGGQLYSDDNSYFIRATGERWT